MVSVERPMQDKRHHIVVHYGELGLKGRNRPVFLHALMHNLERTLSSLGEGSVEQQSGTAVADRAQKRSLGAT